MTAKIWIDDVRTPPDDSWTWCKSSKEAIDLIDAIYILERETRPRFEISFDHDLGGDDTTIPVAKRFEELAFHGCSFALEWHIHSANPVGKKNLIRILESMERFQKIHEE